MDGDDKFSNFEEAGPPLGIVPKTQYKEYKLPFNKSSMYIFTDGITEIKNPEGNELGSKGFQNYIMRYKDKANNERLKLIIDSVLNSKYLQKDDLTIVVVDSK
jgi:sigma-B regulation protein RsbU (phosphoserine phosphatase)